MISAEDMDGDYWLESVPNLSNFYFAAMASIFGDDPRDDVRAFIDAFTAMHGAHPATAHTITGHDAIMGIAMAIERAGSTAGDEVKAALEAFDNEVMLAGPHELLSRPPHQPQSAPRDHGGTGRTARLRRAAFPDEGAGGELLTDGRARGRA